MADQVIVPRRGSDFFNANGEPTLRFIRFLESLTDTTNTTTAGGEDNTAAILANTALILINKLNIDDNAVNITTNTANILMNDGDISALEGRELVSTITDVDYTAEPYQIIICTNLVPINITLNPAPTLNEVVHIKRAEAEVTVLGTIDGITDWVLNVQYWSMQLVFNGTDWSVI